MKSDKSKKSSEENNKLIVIEEGIIWSILGSC
jgi:hypothetical protein